MSFLRGEKTVLTIMLGIAFLFLGCNISVSGTEVPDTGPFEYLPEGYQSFEDIEVDENGFPEGQRGSAEYIQVVDDVARSGSHSLRIDGGSSRYFGLANDLLRPVESGKTYQFKMWYRAPEALAAGDAENIHVLISSGNTNRHWKEEWYESPEPGAQYDYRVGTASGGNLFRLYIIPLSTARQEPGDPTDWHPLSVTYTAPEDDTIASVINIYNTSGYPMWIDDLSFQRL